MKRIIYILLFGTLLFSCDVPGRLVIVNKSDFDVIVNLDSFPAGVASRPFDMSAIHITQENPKITLYYGFGGHNDQTLTELQESFKAVRYIDKGDTITIDDPEILGTMLPKRITGIYNAGLKMKIKNGP